MYLVSIIVPIYNVENYLSRCLDSIIRQTYANLEIILVNDGSTDRCLEICLKYKSLDNRIIVVSQNNQGLSAARNKGIDIAMGEYLMFVDSDDWISSDAVERLLNDLLIQTEAKFAIGQMLKCTDENIDIPKENNTLVITCNEAISRMLCGEWVSACAKLYHRSLFEKIRFPVGRTNEDYAILIYLFENTKKIIVGGYFIYFYYTRPNSICTSQLNIRKFDEFYNAMEVLEYIEKKYPNNQEWIGYARANLSCSLIKLIGQVWNSSREFEFYEVFQKMVKYLDENFGKLIYNRYLPMKYKPFLIAIRSGKIGYSLFNKLYVAYKKEK